MHDLFQRWYILSAFKCLSFSRASSLLAPELHYSYIQCSLLSSLYSIRMSYIHVTKLTQFTVLITLIKYISLEILEIMSPIHSFLLMINFLLRQITQQFHLYTEKNRISFIFIQSIKNRSRTTLNESILIYFWWNKNSLITLTQNPNLNWA